MRKFYGKKLFRYLKIKPDRNPKDCLMSSRTSQQNFVIQVHLDTGRYYMKFVSSETFYSWMITTVPENERTFSEVITNDNNNGKQKFRLDVDGKNMAIDEIERITRTVFHGIGIKNAQLLSFDIKTSYHIVLINYNFISNDICKILATYIENIISRKIPNPGIDCSVYNHTQHFRLEGCTKYGQMRWKVRIGDTPLKYENFHQGVISNLNDTTTIDLPNFSTLIKNPKPHLFKRDKKTKRPIGDYPPEYTIRWTNNDLIALDRISPSFCNQCERNHDNDGAYIYNGNFYCRRLYPSLRF